MWQRRMIRGATLLGVVMSVGLGSWWTAVAVTEGDEVMMLFRFGFGSLAGGYYLMLFRALAPSGD